MTRFCLLLLGLSLAACSAELKGDLQVDGQPFALDSCRSGQIYGFAGVEIVSKQGAKIRIIQAPTGEAMTFLIPAGKSTGVEVGRCGGFSFETQSSTINGVRNIRGDGDLDCAAAGHSIKGRFSFANCH